MNEDLKRLSDDELLRSLQRVARDERRRLVEILRHLQEMDSRRLAAKLGYASLFEYCVRRLRFSEGETARRIQVARSAVKYPRLLRVLDRGLISLSSCALLAPHLTTENFRPLIRRALGKRAREIDKLVASLDPTPEPPERTRFLGFVRPLDTPAPPSDPTSIAAPAPAGAQQELQAPQRVLFSFTADERLLASVERAKELLANKYGDPGYEAVFSEGVDALLDKLAPERDERSGKPRLTEPDGLRSRVPPAWVKRAVWRRDGYRCSFRAPDGARCRSKAGLQFDHVVPWALGGPSDDPANIRLLCRTHNRLEARRALGDGVVDSALAAKARDGAR